MCVVSSEYSPRQPHGVPSGPRSGHFILSRPRTRHASGDASRSSPAPCRGSSACEHVGHFAAVRASFLVWSNQSCRHAVQKT
eukprot:scaffold71307_cov63-Phaeocystis_antarctica.AAC.3